mmetsp:Transcript_47546/g.149407  ORF Transcript_47546/g.149407 Transcript_47546/m.149407 type:complete len:357 (-) Transcript_47546:239-1309(-)
MDFISSARPPPESRFPELPSAVKAAFMADWSKVCWRRKYSFLSAMAATAPEPEGGGCTGGAVALPNSTLPASMARSTVRAARATCVPLAHARQSTQRRASSAGALGVKGLASFAPISRSSASKSGPLTFPLASKAARMYGQSLWPGSFWARASVTCAARVHSRPTPPSWSPPSSSMAETERSKYRSAAIAIFAPAATGNKAPLECFWRESEWMASSAPAVTAVAAAKMRPPSREHSEFSVDCLPCALMICQRNSSNREGPASPAPFSTASASWAMEFSHSSTLSGGGWCTGWGCSNGPWLNIQQSLSSSPRSLDSAGCGGRERESRRQMRWAVERRTGASRRGQLMLSLKSQTMGR